MTGGRRTTNHQAPATNHEPSAISHRRAARRRGGFTLIELLVVTTILLLLASTALFAMWGAQEQAREARARAQLARVEFLMTEKWESFKTIRVPVLPSRVPPTIGSVVSINSRARAFVRLTALRERMRLELPDRRADLMVPPAVTTSPALYAAYLRRLGRLLGTTPPNVTPTVANINWNRWTYQHQGAECLHLILSQMKDGDRNALEAFRTSEIGDTDNDGMPEVLDPWGQPLSFLRWAPGYVSDPASGPGVVTFQSRNAQAYPDPFDPLRSDPRWTDSVVGNEPFLLAPLVFSSGPDKQADVASEVPDASNNPTVDFATISPELTAAAADQVSNKLPNWTVSDTNVMTNDPYRAFTANSVTTIMGVPGGVGSGDNITNQDSEVQ